VRYQIATRALPGPHSTGPLEQFLHHLDATIGDRAARLTNKTRTDALLKLLSAQRNTAGPTRQPGPSGSASTYSPGAAVPPTNASTPTQPPSPAYATPLPRPANVDF